ncbi:Bax inhibitor-1/YccA family protein [Phenylobacterium sp.]|uniref:Bax inhibitor-1/YccA family protein n=1 Tax=Phenylobacterium sp. TaxID=1871053 RepID=UPI002FE2AEDD
MRDIEDTFPHTPATAEVGVDPGLRRYMIAIYNKVALGLALAGALAYATANVPILRDLLFRAAPEGGAGAYHLTFLGGCVAIAPILVLLLSSRPLRRATAFSTGAVYWTVVSLFGAAMGVLVLSFTGLSVATTFAISAAAFGALSLVGYTTRRELTSFGAFLTVGLAGLVGALVLNLVLHSPALAFVTNAVGAFVFAGLIAFDTQRLRRVYEQLAGDEVALDVASNFGALALFINFLNLFQFLLAMGSGEQR